MNPEETVSLAGLVDYQDDSVVSRTLMKKETGTLTVFAFQAGQGLSEHRAPFAALGASRGSARSGRGSCGGRPGAARRRGCPPWTPS